jgi:CHAT domain-containing protein
MGRALVRLASAAYRESDYTLVKQLANRALRLPLSAADRYMPYNILGLAAYYEGRLSEAVPLFDSAIAAARASGDKLNEAKAAMNHGLADADLGDFQLARERFQLAREVARKAGDTRLEGKCIANQAMLEIKAGDPLTAIALLDTARAVYRRSAYAPGEVNALGQLGAAYSAIGEPQRALAALDTAVAQARKHDLPQEEASNLQLLAEQYRDAGDLTRALDYLSRAQQLNESLGLDDDRGTALRDAAEIYLALGQTAVARKHATEAFVLHRASESALEQLVDLLVLATIAERQRQPARVDSLLRAAHEVAQRLGTHDATARVSLASAEIADRSGTPSQVLAALATWGTNGPAALPTEARALALRARAFRRLGELDSAAVIGELAVRAVERVRGRYAFATLRTAYAWQHADIYADLVGVLLRQRRVGDAFAVADAARGRALLEHLTEARGAATRWVGAARDFVASETQLRSIDQLVEQLGSRVTGPPDRGTSLGEASDLASRLTSARTDYEASLERAAADRRGATMLGATRVHADSVRSSLNTGEVLLEYFVSSDRILAFAVTTDTIWPIQLPIDGDQLTSRVRLVREMLGNRATAPGAADAVLASLYTSLIAPVRRAGALVRAERLIVVPHGMLAYLPFAALRNPSTGKYLVDEVAISYEPSAASFAAERSTVARDVPPNGVSTALAPFPTQLPASAAEAQRAARSSGGGVVLEASQASEHAFRHALETSALVHVASHAELNVQNPLFSHISLAGTSGATRDDDGRLEVHELLGMKVRSQLVFLSGCETGVGAAWSTSFRRGEDFATLAQAFLYAGAGSVVATFWRIEDGAAAEFAGRFYDALRDSPAADALAEAQRSMIRDPRFASPFSWAAYAVTGDGARGRVVAADLSGGKQAGRLNR